MSGFFHSRRTRFAPVFRDAESCNCDLGKPCAEHERTSNAREHKADHERMFWPEEQARRAEMDDVPLREEDE